VSSGEEFRFQQRSDGTVAISHRGRVVTLLRHERARRFMARAAEADPKARQQLMARATGNFKRGNERARR
jgi:hypothetical protein